MIQKERKSGVDLDRQFLAIKVLGITKHCECNG